MDDSTRDSIRARPQAAPVDGRGRTYRYHAARLDGQIEFGTIEAKGRELVSHTLAERGLFPLKIEADEERTRSRSGTRLPADDLALGLRALATLLDAGLPMGRALASFDELAPESWRPVLPAIIDAVHEGRGLATALVFAGADVPQYVIGMMRAGEAGGTLALAVLRAAELAERNARTRAAIRNALAYPIILALAGGASVVLLVGVVLPRFSVLLADLGLPLPATTRAVLTVAETARALTIPALSSTLLIGACGRAWIASTEGLQRWHELLLGLPIVGPIRRSTGAARMTGALASLLESGVPVVTALGYAAQACGDAALEARLQLARTRVVAGGRIARALESADATTSTAIRLIHAGEESGHLTAMLAHASRLEAERTERALKATVRLLEPSLILAFGGVVALVAAALLQAVYAIRPGA